MLTREGWWDCECCAVDIPKPSSRYQSGTQSYYTPGIRFSAATSNLYRKLSGDGSIRLHTDDSGVSLYSGDGHIDENESTISGEITHTLDAYGVTCDTSIYDDSADIPAATITLPDYPAVSQMITAEIDGTCATFADPNVDLDYDVNVGVTITWSTPRSLGSWTYPNFNYPRYGAFGGNTFSAESKVLPNGMSVTVSYHALNYDREIGSFGNFVAATETSRNWDFSFNNSDSLASQTLSDLISADDFLDDVETEFDPNDIGYTSSFATTTLTHSGISYIPTAKSEAHRASVRGARHQLRVPSTHTGSKCYAKYEIYHIPDGGVEEILSEGETTWTGPIDPNDDDSRNGPWIYLPLKANGEVGLRFTQYRYYASSAWHLF